MKVVDGCVMPDVKIEVTETRRKEVDSFTASTPNSFPSFAAITEHIATSS